MTKDQYIKLLIGLIGEFIDVTSDNNSTLQSCIDKLDINKKGVELINRRISRGREVVAKVKLLTDAVKDAEYTEEPSAKPVEKQLPKEKGNYRQVINHDK